MKFLTCFLGLYLAIESAFGSSDELCQKCTTVLQEFRYSMKTGEEKIKTYSQKVCTDDKQCEEVTQHFINIVRILKNRTENLDPKPVCTHLEYCKPESGSGSSSGNPALSSKFVLALAEFIKEALEKITSAAEHKPYDEFCAQCSDIVPPVTLFFSKNIIELEKKETRVCEELQDIKIPKRSCENFIDSLLSNMKDTDASCNFICNRKRTSLEKINEETSVAVKKQIKQTMEGQKEKIESIKHEVLDSKEVFPNVLTSDGINSFCALCVLGTSKLPENEEFLLAKLSKILCGIFLETKDTNLIDRVKKSIQPAIHSLIEYYSAPTFCTSAPVHACSSDSYDLVKTFLGKKSSTECESCKTFSSYVGPILKKPGAHEELVAFLTAKVFEILPATVFDYVNINAKDYVIKAINFAADYVNDEGTCESSGFCEAKPKA